MLSLPELRMAGDFMPDRGLISTIQAYSTKDGPGIRSTVFLVGCNLKCIWCANPELISPEPKIMYFENRCRQCGKCVATAVNNSIVFSENACKIDRKLCTNLEECMKICPYDAYEKLGYEISPEELYEKLIRDKVFYEQSDGGVTFSGGEPALQSDFVIKVASILRKNGVHVALDTAGLVLWDIMEKLIENVDMVLFDIKAYDNEIHKNCTGVSNEIILENAKKIAEKDKDMIIRMVIIPGLNDDIEDIKKRISFVKSLGKAVKQIDILKYHNLGEGKYKSLGMEYLMEKGLASDSEFIEIIKKAAEETGIKVTIDG